MQSTAAWLASEETVSAILVYGGTIRTLGEDFRAQVVLYVLEEGIFGCVAHADDVLCYGWKRLVCGSKDRNSWTRKKCLWTRVYWGFGSRDGWKKKPCGMQECLAMWRHVMFIYLSFLVLPNISIKLAFIIVHSFPSQLYKEWILRKDVTVTSSSSWNDQESKPEIYRIY
jgi:hypothetical protein